MQVTDCGISIGCAAVELVRVPTPAANATLITTVKAASNVIFFMADSLRRRSAAALLQQRWPASHNVAGSESGAQDGVSRSESGYAGSIQTLRELVAGVVPPGASGVPRYVAR